MQEENRKTSALDEGYITIVAQVAIFVKRLRGAVLRGFINGPVFDVDKTVSGIDEAIFFGEGAHVAIKVIDEAGLIDADGGDVVDPAAQESFVLAAADGGVHGTASADDEVID